MNIDNKVDELTKNKIKPKKKSFRRISILGKTISIPSLLYLIGVVVVSAVLISWYGTYSLTFEGDIELNGQDPYIYLDGTGIVGQTASFNLDTTTLNAGDTIAETHEIVNSNTFPRVLSWDKSAITFTDPENEYYGYEVKILDSGDNEIEKLVVDVGSTDNFKIQHSLHEDFMNTNNLLEFDLGMEITVTELHGEIGFWVYKDDSDSQVVSIDVFGTNDNLLEIWDIDKTTLQLEKDFPSSETDWNILVDTINNIDYDGGHESISCIWFDMLGTGIEEWFALIPNEDLGATTNVVIKNTFYFGANTDNAQAGHIFNFEDTDNYYSCFMNIENNKLELHQIEDGIDTTLDTVSASFNSETSYELETHLDLFGDCIEVLIDDTSVLLYDL